MKTPPSLLSSLFPVPLLHLLASPVLLPLSLPLLFLRRRMFVSTAYPSPPSSFFSSPLLLRSRGLSPFRTALDWKMKEIRRQLVKNGNQGGERGRGVCRAELSHDAPFAVAIGACVLNSLVFPIPSGGVDDEDGGGAIDSTDARFAVMGIISFIPYFNWLSWVFAWLDSGRQRYLVYSIVYLAPYLRTNLSLSPEESWLPVASIVVCIVHIQLEASIRNGDLEGIRFFDQALKLFSPMIRKKDTRIQSHQETPKKGRSKRHIERPSTHDSREKIRDWGSTRKPDDDLEHLNENSDVDARERNSD